MASVAPQAPLPRPLQDPEGEVAAPQAARLQEDQGAIDMPTDNLDICGPVAVPITIQFDNVSYSVPVPSGKRFRKARKDILSDLSGRLYPGQLTALMGPSGSGKSSLLNILGNRVSHGKGRVTGTVLFNGERATPRLRKHTGFVLQDDVLFAYLTVRETFMYAAMLKLPKTMSQAQKSEAVDKVVHTLHLEDCMNTKVGGPLSRGISGGERKRTSIGVEMLINPSMLLMDEPTSGLDSAVALELVQVLKQFAIRDKRNVVCVIHQPSSELFFLFDQLLLMVHGKFAYRGPVSRVVPYFTDRGFECPMHSNPADYIMILMVQKKQVAQQFIEATTVTTAEYLAQQPPVKPVPVNGGKKEAIYETSFCKQVVLLTRRSFKQQFFSIMNIQNIMQSVLSSILAGLFWLQIPYLETHLNDRYGLLFFITLFWAFTPFNIAMISFPIERAVIEKENFSLYYRLEAYLVAKALTEMPIIAVLVVVSTTIVYFMGNLQYTFLSWFETELVLVLTTWTMQSFAFLIGVIAGDYYRAVGLGTALILVSMLVAGFYIRFIPIWLVWTRYISVIYYSLSLMTAVQFNPTTIFTCDANPPTIPACAAGATTFPGNDFLVQINNFNVWGLNMGILLASIFLFRFLSFFVLKIRFR